MRKEVFEKMRIKRILTILLSAVVLTSMLGISSFADDTGKGEEITTANLKSVTTKITQMEESEAVAYAKKNATPLLVAGLIGEIYIHPKKTPEEQEAQQKMVEKTAKAAKAAYNALSEEGKKNVPEIPDGCGYEYPGAGGADYFVPTGDASRDDPLNTVPDKKKEILVTSFGTSFTDSRIATIGGIEKALAKAYPGYSVRRAFTSQIIINHILARDEEHINTVREALNQAKEAGVTELIVQPTTLMSGEEYDLLVQNVKNNKGNIRVTIARPLLHSDADRTAVAKRLAAAAAKQAGAGSITSSKARKTAFVFMGHGTSHTANVTYAKMQNTFSGLKYKNVFVGTVEGMPKSTELNTVIKKVKKAGYRNVILRPMMVVAGDHANNDMAGDEEDSWKTGFMKAGLKVECQIEGLGEIASVQQIYVAHTKAAIAKANGLKAGKIKRLKAGKKKFTVSVVKKSGNRYQLRYSKKKNMKGAKTVTLKGSSKTIKKLKKRTRYYVQVRTFVKADGTNYTSDWSSVKSVKVR